MTIKISLDLMLRKRGRSFYWLSKQHGISHTTLWRFKKGKALGINFVTLEKICRALECLPGDILLFEDAAPLPGPAAAGENRSRGRKA
jgi:putative transcriptional regulator